MHRANLFVIGAGLLLAASSPAFAEGEGEGSATVEAGGGAEAGAGGATAGASGEASATVGADGAMMAAWPQAAIDRPYTLPAGKLAVYGSLNVAHLSITVAGMTASATGEGLGLGAGFGVNDKITAGAQYAFPIAGDTGDKGKGPLSLYGEFKLAHSAKMSVAASASFTIDLGADNAKLLNAGLGLRYNVAPKVAIFTGSPYGPGPVGQHLSVSLESSGPINFNIPAGVGFQATPQIFAFLDTNIATIRLANKPDGADAVTFIGTEAGGIPLDLGMVFALNNMLDVRANLTFIDAKHAGDFWAISVGAAYYK